MWIYQIHIVTQCFCQHYCRWNKCVNLYCSVNISQDLIKDLKQPFKWLTTWEIVLWKVNITKCCYKLRYFNKIMLLLSYKRGGFDPRNPRHPPGCAADIVVDWFTKLLRPGERKRYLAVLTQEVTVGDPLRYLFDAECKARRCRNCNWSSLTKDQAGCVFLLFGLFLNHYWKYRKQISVWKQ